MKIAITLTSSLNVGSDYIDLTRQVATKLATEGFGIVYGGTAYGMMLELANSYRDAGGKTLVGVLARDLISVTKAYEIYPHLTETFTFDTYGERKDKITNYSDGMLILPGGYGTIDEMVTIVSAKANKLIDKPIAVYNYKGYYNTFEKFFNELEEKKFSKIRFGELVFVSEDLNEILAYFRSYSSAALPDKFVS